MYVGGHGDVLGGVGAETVVFRVVAPPCCNPLHLASGSPQEEHVSLSKIGLDYATFNELLGAVGRY